MSDDAAVNPALLRHLGRALGLRVTADDLRDPYGGLGYASVVERLREAAPPHVADGFAVAHRALVGTFGGATLAAADELAGRPDLLADSPVVAALAGRPGRRRGAGEAPARGRRAGTGPRRDRA